MSKAKKIETQRRDGPSAALVRKTVRVRISAGGSAYVSPSIAALSPNQVYDLIKERIRAVEAG